MKNAVSSFHTETSQTLSAVFHKADITQPLTGWTRAFNVCKCIADLDHGFGQQLGSEQLQHGVHYVLPALPQDVAVPMGEVKHCLGCCLCLTIAAKHCRKVFHRLQGERTHQHAVNRHSDNKTAFTRLHKYILNCFRLLFTHATSLL